MITVENESIDAFIAALNSSGGIPLTINMVAEQNATQFWVTIAVALIGSMFILFYISQALRPIIGDLVGYIRIWQLRRITGRHILLIKHTGSALFSQSMIDTNTLYKVENAFKKFKGKPFDLILHTPGGQVFATQLLSKAIKAYPGTVRAIVPIYAMSGGTFLALSCDEVCMGKTACLGPVDPQLGSLFSYGSARSWQEVVRKKGRRADDFSIQRAFEGRQYERTLQAMIDELLWAKIPDQNGRARAVLHLTSGDVEHALPLSIEDLRGLGIPVTEIDGRIRAMLMDIIVSKNIEGVFAC